MSCELEEDLDIFGGLACFFMVVKVPCIIMDSQAILEGCLWFLHQVDGFGRSWGPWHVFSWF